jgi:hypothetical protein
MEARILSRYLCREQGDFFAASNEMELDPPKSGVHFLENWKPIDVRVENVDAIAYRSRTASGLTYFVTSDFNVGSKATHDFKKLLNEQNQRPIDQKRN